MSRQHGPHTCYCPNCGTQVTADSYVQCKTLTCPDCGQRMRALETGEYRQTRRSGGLAATVGSSISATTVGAESIACPVCAYPIPDPRHEGTRVRCAYCGTISEAIAQGVTIPTWLLTLGIGLGVGIFAGPSILASTEAGSQYLARKARERFG